MKKYRRVVFPGTEEWCKVKRKTDSWIQKWHEEFREFSPSHSKVQKSHFDGLFYSKLYGFWAKKKILKKSEKLYIDGLFLSKAFNVSARKFQRNYVSWHWRVMQNLKENWLNAWKISSGICLIFMRAVESLEISTLMAFFCPKHLKI